MDCTLTDSGWFDVKGFVTDGYSTDKLEEDVSQGACYDGPATTSVNHKAQCGQMNVFHFGSSECDKYPIPEQNLEPAK